jgi:broad specificity phosphatase PhoE
MPLPRRIFFIRHGESQANVDLAIHASVPDHKISLTERGHAQAREAGQRLRQLIGDSPVAVYVSPFLRARQTCAGICDAFPNGQIQRVREDPRIREQEHGNYSTPEDFARIDVERKNFGIFFYRIPNGESGADVYDRATGFLDTLYRDFEREDYPPNVIVVSHGLTLRLVLMRWLHWTVEEFERSKNPENCQFFELRPNEKGHYKLVVPFPQREVK